MRNMWRITPDSNRYRSLAATEMSAGDELDIWALFKSGASIGGDWKPVRVGLWGNGEEAHKPVGHFPSAAGLAPLAISAHAWGILSPLIRGDAELLEFTTEPPLDRFYAMNIYYADCLDQAKSKVLRFEDGRVMRVVKYCLFETRLQGRHIFRIPEEWTYVFADDVFKRAVEESGLRGLLFREVAS